MWVWERRLFQKLSKNGCTNIISLKKIEPRKLDSILDQIYQILLTKVNLMYKIGYDTFKQRVIIHRQS